MCWCKYFVLFCDFSRLAQTFAFLLLGFTSSMNGNEIAFKKRKPYRNFNRNAKKTTWKSETPCILYTYHNSIFPCEHERKQSQGLRHIQLRLRARERKKTEKTKKIGKRQDVDDEIRRTFKLDLVFAVQTYLHIFFTIFSCYFYATTSRRHKIRIDSSSQSLISFSRPSVNIFRLLLVQKPTTPVKYTFFVGGVCHSACF